MTIPQPIIAAIARLLNESQRIERQSCNIEVRGVWLRVTVERAERKEVT
jgi:hypothetical protein